MYSSAGYGSVASELTNNPFVNNVSNANTRFPDISAATLSSQPQVGQYSSQMQGSAATPGYQAQAAQMGVYQPQPYAQPPSFDAGYVAGAQPYPLGPSQQPPQLLQQQAPSYSQQFQPTSSFGQQLVGQLNGSGYGYLQGQGAGFETLTAAQQQIRNNPGYVAQFDPYASIGQGWDGQIQPQNQPQLQGSSQLASPSRGSISSQPSSSSSSSSNPHPRDYIRTHKAELESWDMYSWKQLFNTFDALKDAWDVRKQELQGNMAQLQAQMQYGGYYAGQIQQELGRLQSLVKDANSNTDSVAASLFQMKEVYAGYRQSGDPASKRRVRESCNAALQSLPEWPQAY